MLAKATHIFATMKKILAIFIVILATFIAEKD